MPVRLLPAGDGFVTAAERALWQKVQRRARDVSPELAAAMLRAFARLRDSMSEAELSRAIALGFAERIFAEILTHAVLDVAFQPVRQRLRETIVRGVPYYAKGLPGKVGGEVSIGFDTLSPKVVEAIRALETRVITTLQEDIRAMVRQVVERGLIAGAAPKTIARELRAVIGLAPNQEQAVENFRLALRGENPHASPTDYKLRDKRFDRTVAQGNLTEAQVEKMTAAYRKRWIAHNADTNARTASLDAQKLANRLSWQESIDRGFVDGSRLEKTWRGVMDDRERPEHIAMEGETVPFALPYSNGEDVPGASTFNCRCVSIYKVRAA
jgi:hypothetical protein